MGVDHCTCSTKRDNITYNSYVQYNTKVMHDLPSQYFKQILNSNVLITIHRYKGVLAVIVLYKYNLGYVSISLSLEIQFIVFRAMLSDYFF